jgi:hypothetical protein
MRMKLAGLGLACALAAVVLAVRSCDDAHEGAGLTPRLTTQAPGPSTARETRRTPPPAAVAETEPEPPSVVVTVRNLADGSLIGNEDFTLRFGGEQAEEVQVRTDARGRLAVPGDISGASLVHPTLRVLGALTSAQEESESVLWAHSLTDLSGIVVSDPSDALPDLSQVRLRYELQLDRRGSDLRPGGTVPWTRAWAAQHGLRTRDTLGTVNRDGSFQFPVPRVRTLLVVANLDGWRPAWATVDVSGPDPAAVTLVMRRSVLIRGRLLAEDGSAIAGARVAYYSGVRVPLDTVDVGTLGLDGSGFSVSGNPRYNTAKVTIGGGAVTDADGAFVVHHNADGEVLLMSWPLNQAVTSLFLGRVEQDRSDAVLVSRGSTGKRVRFLADGEPLANVTIVLGDLSAPVGQPTVGGIRLSAEGEMAADWLEVGHRYGVMVLVGSIADRLTREDKVVLVWGGQASVDVTTDLVPLD